MCCYIDLKRKNIFFFKMLTYLWYTSPYMAAKKIEARVSHYLQNSVSYKTVLFLLSLQFSLRYFFYLPRLDPFDMNFDIHFYPSTSIL